MSSLCSFPIALGLLALTVPSPATWTKSTSYVVGDLVVAAFGLSPKVYECVQAGTSAVSGSGPVGTGAGIVDGSCEWDYVSAFETPPVPALLALTLPMPPCYLDEY